MRRRGVNATIFYKRGSERFGGLVRVFGYQPFEIRLFRLVKRQIIRSTGAQVASKDSKAIMAATGQDIVCTFVTHL